MRWSSIARHHETVDLVHRGHTNLNILYLNMNPCRATTAVADLLGKGTHNQIISRCDWQWFEPNLVILFDQRNMCTYILYT